MLAEFIERIAALVRGGEFAKIVNSPADPGGEVLVLLPGGKIETRERAPRPRLTLFDDYASFVDYVRSNACPKPEVYVAASGISVCPDVGTRSDGSALSFSYTAAFRWLQSLSQEPEKLTAPEAINRLRFSVGTAEVGALISALRRVDFSRRSDGSVVTEHGRESLGRSVEVAVQQTDAIPEFYALTVPVFCNDPIGTITAKVRLGIRILPTEESFELEPIADDVEIAQRRALAEVGERLRDSMPDVPVYIGSAFGYGASSVMDQRIRYGAVEAQAFLTNE